MKHRYKYINRNYRTNYNMQIFLQILPVLTSDIELRSVQASTKHTENLITKSINQ